MNNLLLYCGLVDAKIRASDKDLPVLFQYLQVPLDNMRQIHYLITIAPLLIGTRVITVTNSMIWSKLL